MVSVDQNLLNVFFLVMVQRMAIKVAEGRMVLPVSTLYRIWALKQVGEV